MTPDPTFLNDLRLRGLVHQTTSPDLEALLAKESVVGYIGFDPTADSLHLGSLLPLITLMRFQRAGHRPIAVVGGGTGLVGDPSGKATERTLLTPEVLNRNLWALRLQIGHFLDDESWSRIVNNNDWLGSMSVMDFLRDVGKHFSVNAMMSRDSVKDRLENREQGISFTEFSYMLLQSFDFVALNDRFNCQLQMGGSDQWGNITSGVDLVRRMRNREVFGLTQPLVLKSDGTKFGKSEAGNIWLDASKTSPFEMFQFLLNTEDADVIRFLKFFTFLELEHIEALEEQVKTDPKARIAQRLLAQEVVRLVHGGEALQQAERASSALFREDWATMTPTELEQAFAHLPKTLIKLERFGSPDFTLVQVLVETGLVSSKGQGWEMITKGGISMNSSTMLEPKRILCEQDLMGGRFVVLKRGKKTWYIIQVVR